MTTPIVGCVWSTPPIVYAVVVMFVCGGFSTCLSVWLGEVKRNRWNEAGRHFWSAARRALDWPPFEFPPKPPPPLPPPNPPPPPPFPLPGPKLIPAFARQACIFAKSAADGRTRRVCVIVFACVFSVATIFGTTPSWCSASNVRPCVTWATSRDRRDLAGRALLERELRPGQEEVVHEVGAGLAELRQVGDDREVRLDQITIPAAATGTTLKPARVLLGRRQGDRQIGADPGERVQRLLLRLVQPARRHRRSRSRALRRGRDRAR